MTNSFIYVFTDKDKESLLKAGFILLKEDVEKNTYVFANNDKLRFTLVNLDCVKSNTLTF